MKNLKKVLALVLAFACAFTMFAGAAFTDAADINADNADAVELLTALNIIEGYEDGSFQPEGTVTRAEMAKMIFTIRNGGNDDASAYESVTTSFTDINGHWAAGYIKYLQNTGIVAGKSAYIFDPDSTVTTAEAMKMALVLAGYRADKANLTGTAWQNNTIALATTVGLTKDVFSAVAEGCSRQDAAQILSNTLTEVKAVQWSEVTNSFLNDSDAGLAWGGDWMTVGEKWMDLAIATGYLTYGPSSKTNPKGIGFQPTDGYNGDRFIDFRDTKIDVSDLFGYEVKVVWDSEHEDSVEGVYGVYKTADNDSSEAMWKDVKSTAANKVKLNDETLTAAKNDIAVYVNGADTATLDLDADMNESARADIINFIDNNGDGKIDVATIKNQNVVKITYVSEDKLNTSALIGTVLTGTHDSAANGYLSTDEFTNYTVDPDMSDVNTYEGIAKNDYAKVTYDYYNDKMTYEKIDAVEGTITATRTNQGTKEIRIDGTWYKAALGYTLPSLVSGDTVEYIAIDNLIYNAKKVDGTWGSKNLAIVSEVAKYNAGVNAADLQIKLLTRDGDTKTVILDKYNNVDVTTADNGNTYNIDIANYDGVTENYAVAGNALKNALCGQLVTYRESGSSVSLMPVAVADLNANVADGYEFTQKAGYDDVYDTTGVYTTANNTIEVDAKDAVAMANTNLKIAGSAVVFVWDMSGDAKVLTGSELDKAGVAATGVSAKVVGGSENGVNYVQGCAIKVADVDTVKETGSNYAYVLSAAETTDNDDYRYFELWTKDGKLEAYEESSDEYTYKGGEIVRYEVVSTGDRTVIKNVELVDETIGTNQTWVSYITSDGFYGSNSDKIAIHNTEYTLASDCFIVNVNTDDMSGIEGDAKSAAREAMKRGGAYVDNVVFVLDGDGDIVFLMIDGKNNEIFNKNLYE